MARQRALTAASAEARRLSTTGPPQGARGGTWPPCRFQRHARRPLRRCGPRRPRGEAIAALPRGVNHNAAVNDIRVLEQLMIISVNFRAHQLGRVAVKVRDGAHLVEELLCLGVVFEEAAVRAVDRLEVPLVARSRGRNPMMWPPLSFSAVWNQPAGRARRRASRPVSQIFGHF